MTLVLASTSQSRRAMLTAAGVPHEALASGVDEDPVKQALIARGAPHRDIADALAELKAVKVSLMIPPALVLGGDSVVALDDGRLLDKPESREQAAEHLRMLSGRTHDLWSAAVIAEQGRAVWRFVDRARLTMRPLSEVFIQGYLDAEWPAIAGCVGCYRMEGPGVQLFARVQGSHFTILGMPMLQILDYLRTRGEMTS
ncbi:Maf family protein [Sphingomonas sp. BGYR3]|uniref:Maf family protein n=1 Tax=Sphingomonas sp. BGYR3 TaxID=2975483 RepID=UPI0021A266FE|nr:Maf family protein [Sphingomonas sp. BGYR3]